MPDTRHPFDWDELFRQQVPDALRLAIRLTGNPHDAEDIVQESFLRAARSKETFRGDCSFRLWLRRIIVNVFRTWMSSRRPVKPLIDDPPESRIPSECPVENAERGEQIAMHVSRLPERQREVLVFCVYDNLTAAETAELLGLSLQNVYSNLSAAKRQLRESLWFLMTPGAER